MAFNKKVGIIGCGNMGEALLGRLSEILERSTSLMVSERDAARRDYIQAKFKMVVEMDNNRLIKYSDVVILAVKPDDFEKLFDEICPSLSADKLLISIAAGVRTGYIEQLAKERVPVVRVMPNMAALIGEAISSISPGRYAKRQDIKIAEEIFSTIGDVVEVDEELVDAVTAVSGSGPAYFFYLVESLIEAAKDLGLGEEVAKRLVKKTALGSAKLLEGLKTLRTLFQEKHLLIRFAEKRNR